MRIKRFDAYTRNTIIVIVCQSQIYGPITCLGRSIDHVTARYQFNTRYSIYSCVLDSLATYISISLDYSLTYAK